jgi:hypothetical protein
VNNLIDALLDRDKIFGGDLLGDRVGNPNDQPIMHLVPKFRVFEIGIHAREGIQHGVNIYGVLNLGDSSILAYWLIGSDSVVVWLLGIGQN